MKNLLFTALLGLAALAPVTETAQAQASQANNGFDVYHAQAHGYWTRCWVNVHSGLQIAVPNAASFEACQSAALRCLNGRSYQMIGFNSTAVLQSAPRVERCNAAS